MSRIVRRRSIPIGDEDGNETTIRLKTWSAGKLFYIVRDLWSLIEDALSRLDLNKMNEMQLIQSMVELLLSSEDKAAKIIEMTIDDPKGIKANDILEWDATDFVRVLSMVVEMNVNEELVKNSRALLNNLFRQISKESVNGAPLSDHSAESSTK